MKQILIRILLGVLALVVAPTISAQGPNAKGFDALLCIAETLLPGTQELKSEGDIIPLFGGQVTLTAVSDASCTGLACEITVQIDHGASLSIHTINFVDQNNSGGLNCGDIITAVS